MATTLALHGHKGCGFACRPCHTDRHSDGPVVGCVGVNRPAAPCSLHQGELAAGAYQTLGFPPLMVLMMTDYSDVHTLRKEVLGLFEHIQKIRREIAGIHRPGGPEDRFLVMSDQLDAIVAATEEATNTIMEAAEEVDRATAGLMDHVSDPEARARLEGLPDAVGRIFEACAFQDITGQRITKVVHTLKLIEERVHSLITIWGKEAIAQAAEEDGREEPAEDPDQALLNGPALGGQGVTQADIDKLFD